MVFQNIKTFFLWLSYITILPISGKIDSIRRTELRKHNDPLPLNCHDLRCLVDAFRNQLGANETDNSLGNNGRPKLDGGDVVNCCDDATASQLSSEIGIIILIFTR